MRFPCVHAVATTPAQRTDVLVAQSSSRVSLPRNRYLVGLSIVLFEDCLVFTDVRPASHQIRDRYPRLQPLRFLRACSGCFRLERSPGGAYTTGKRRLVTAHTRSRL